MRRRLVLVTGGARSGKSSFALAEASLMPGRKAFIATAEAVDAEMQERIERHRGDRGKEWETFEEPLLIPKVLEETAERYPVLVLDCLTLWLANVLMKGRDAAKETDELILAIKRFRGKSSGSLFIVSNEVGMGIVPENELARKFRDHAGFLNQKVAAVCDEVFMTVAGIPVRIKNKGEAQ